MHETPAAFNAALSNRSAARRYPADNLAGFRWHTGADVRPVAPAETCPVLFRDLGPQAMALFLRGQLRRLAGPLSPILYLRTVNYVEPYTDHEPIGRLIFPRPLLLHPWHAGVAEIYVAPAHAGPDAETVGFVPADMPLSQAAQLSRELTNAAQLRELLGGRAHDEARAETLHALDRLAVELACTENRAAPLRRGLQTADLRRRERIRADMERVGLTEADLCTAWHHLPRSRRGWIAEALRRVDDEFCGPGEKSS